mmetsp:Transcript_22296/g.25625  ORF Transcript_22296/g.25625 Transcript_22296/m.25625 type:complete len:125 (-) Transcript_22296:296-670(-)
MPERHLSYVAFISCTLYLVLTIQGGTTHAQLTIDRDASTREHVVKNYEKRREQLKKLVAQTKEQLEDHNNGRNLLEDEEYNRLTKRIPLYEKKIEQMAGPVDDRMIDKMMDRTKMRELRRHSEL